ncbi:hypothetical protein RB598_004805 [Gaeumannomyces tritici]
MPGDGASSSAAPVAGGRGRGGGGGGGGGGASSKASASSAKPQILTFSLNERPRATRASQPKARTGCKTCERRHVKCDETKPACLRCVKWQGFCEGYEHLAAPAAGNEGAATGGKQRRSKKDVAAASTATKDHSVVVWQPTEHQGMYAQDPDKIYFDHWLQLSDILDGSWFGSDLWTRTIPQLSRTDPTLRYASMAIGALSQAMAMVPQSRSTPRTGVGSPCWSQASNGALVTHSRHYRDAVVYYGRALRLASERRPNQGPNQTLGQTREQAQAAQTQMLLQGGHHAEDALRATVLSCILFLCFETIHGNRPAALRHLIYGGRVVASWVESCFVKQLIKMGMLPSPPQSVASSPPAAEESAEATGTAVTAETTETAETAAGNGNGEATPKEMPLPVLGTSPDPYVLQDEVLQVFQRLDCQCIAAGLRVEFEEDQESFRDLHPQSISRTAYVMRNISRRAFPNIAEARRKWDTISHWLIKIEQTIKMHSVPLSTREEKYIPKNANLVDEGPVEGPLDKAGHPLLAGPRFSPDPPSAQSPSDSPTPLEGESYLDWDQLNMDLLGSFGAAWAPLYRRILHEYEAALTSGDGVPSADATSAMLQAANVQAQYHLSRMWARSRGFADLTAVRAMTPDFREYCRLGELLLRGRAGANFTMDYGPTLGLYRTALACRDPAVRERAIRLLEEYPQRDGFLDSRALVAAMRLSQEVEAENAVEGTTEEQWARLKRRRYVFDERLPILTFTCVRRDWHAGRWVTRDHIFRW